MAWRFKASKYKNAAPIEPKLDLHIRDLSIGSYHSCGNFIGASSAYIAFNWDTLGSSLAVLPLNTTGRPDKASIPRIDAHTQIVTDFSFSPFDDGLIATGSQDQTIKVWKIPKEGLSRNLSTPELTLPEQPRRVETVGFHPTADAILTTSCGTGVSIWDITQGKDVFGWNGHQDWVQSVAWQWSGNLLATQSKDKMLRIFDPRTVEGPTHETNSHDGMKDSKVVWVGDNRVLTSGFGSDRCRELMLRDIRNISVPQKSLSLDVSSGILVPLYDPDTNMVFLSGKGDRYIQFVEVSDKDPWFVEGLRYTGEQIKGACLIPKRSVDVMQGEVNRVLQLANSSIIPIMWQVPRKSYREYHGDIYPDTPSCEPSMGPQDWLDGGNMQPSKQSLNPSNRTQELTRFGKPPRDITRKLGHHTNGNSQNDKILNSTPSQSMDMSPKPSPRPRVARSFSEGPSGPQTAPKPAPRPISAPKPIQEMSMPPPTMPKPALVSSKSVEEADETDNFKRQPSIRDRMKMFETWGSKEKAEKNKTNEETVQMNKDANISARFEKKMDTEDMLLEENKENKPMEIEPDNKIQHQRLEIDHESLLKPKSRSDKNEPFLMPQVRPHFSAMASPNLSNNRLSKFGRVTKFRHMKGTPMHKSMHFENLKNLSKSVPADCDFIHVNPERLVVPLSGPGGKLAVFEMSKSGRIPDGVTPAVINTATVMDFAWDPFNNSRLAVVTDDGAINLWEIPEGGLYHQVNEPTVRIPAHSEKVNIIKFNPLVSDIVATSAFDWQVKIWHLAENSKEMAVLEGHTDQIYSMDWSQCGRFLATVCRDGRIRIYNPRLSPLPVREDGDIVAKKGARVLWALDGKYLIVTGFSRQSERQVMIYETKDLNCIHTETLDVSPGVLVPYYDEDSSTLFLSGKGETTVYGFEVAEDSPHMFLLSPFKCSTPSQGLAFIPHKNAMNVRDVEFARGYRLTVNAIIPISFTVPRVKSTFFQDDIFPPTRVLWTPASSGSAWLEGKDSNTAWISLKPADMPSLSNSTPTPHKIMSQAQKPNIKTNITLTKDEAKEVGKDLTESVSKMLETSDTLEQDTMEGVDDKDWDDEN